MARKLLGLTLIMQAKLTDNLNSCRHQGAPRLSPRQGKRKPEQSATATDTARESLAAERLESAGKLAAWLAHQINNPLGAISGNSQLLARRLQRDVSDPEALEEYLRYLDAIQSHVERCARITGDILSFTQCGEPDIRKVDVREVIREAVELAQYVRPGCEIECDSSRKRIPVVAVDSEWLSRVIFELLANAIEACPSRPVRVDVASSGRGNGGKVLVRISDSGSGIAEDVRLRVFDPFFSTNDKARGLGLTVGLELMRKMHGTLEIERSDETGCTFSIGVPVWETKD